MNYVCDLELTNLNEGIDDKLQLKIRTPYFVENNKCWCCEYSIECKFFNKSENVFGEDPLFVLYVILERVRELLDDLNVPYSFKGAPYQQLIPMHAPPYKYGEEFHFEVENLIKKSIQKKKEEWHANRARKEKG